MSNEVSSKEPGRCSNDRSLENMRLNDNKAGMKGLDTERINKIIMDASKGSKFYLHKQKRQQQLDLKLKALQLKMSHLSESVISTAEKEIDQFIAFIEKSRDLSRTIVHVDMDAFYAAVEMRDDESLKRKPMAVGSMGMLSTSNYLARKYGVRAGMPGFIGKKLCPELVLVEPNFDKYRRVSEEVKNVLRIYDPDFCSMGLDEAYLDITNYLEHLNGRELEGNAENVVAEMRLKIFEATHLTASAGIAPNMLLAKISSDMNKPDGQFSISADVSAIKNFIQNLSIRKVWGIGPVAEQQLKALGIYNCNDILEKRGIIKLLFSSISSKFFIEAALGSGSTCVKSERSQKSISVERTFSEISSFDEYTDKCRDLCEELIADMKKQKIKGKTVSIKLKTVGFDVRTRSVSLHEYTDSYHAIYRSAIKLLKAEIGGNSQDVPKLRLMGVRMSCLSQDTDVKQSSLTHFMTESKPSVCIICPVCNEQQQFANMEMATMHIENCLCLDTSNSDECVSAAKELKSGDHNLDDATEAKTLTCPVCQSEQKVDLLEFNKHVDTCLSKSAIKEILGAENSDDRKADNHNTSQFQKESKSNGKTIDYYMKDKSSKEKNAVNLEKSTVSCKQDVTSLKSARVNENVYKVVRHESSASLQKHEAKSDDKFDSTFRGHDYTSDEYGRCKKAKNRDEDGRKKHKRKKSSRREYENERKDYVQSSVAKRRDNESKHCKNSKQKFSEDGSHEYEVRDSSEDESPSQELDDNVYCDVEFKWTSYRSILNKMFFSDSDFICRGSKELDDFWAFLLKYQAMQRKKISATLSNKLCDLPSQPSFKDLSDIPESYVDELDRRFKISSLSERLSALYFKVHLYDEESRASLPEARIKEFRYIVKLYLNFCVKQEYNKVKKLRVGQSNLPISRYRDEILKTVKDHHVVVIAGDTGCGKSTQVPQYLLRSGYSKIACTQPRRIACISLCKRVSYETLNEYKSEVGYQIRFDRSKTQHTRILFLTEGLLLRQVCSDSTLTSYDVLVLDEVHERHLHGDFLLGVVKCMIQKRPNLKVVLMSATINIDLFARYFNGIPIIQVPGRLFPIEVIYRPISVVEKGNKSSRLDPAPYIRILEMIDKKFSENERGDLLIFLSGMSDITSVADAANIYAEQTKGWIVLPLHSTLSIAEQDKVFDIAPDRVRKCIISTNIAETSITIDGIRFVVDSGKVKEMNYDSITKIQKLQEFWISRASAEQRKGRAGRTGPGICYRLYSIGDYDEMLPYSTPEIQRVPLDSLILQMLAMGLPDARKFPFIQPPPMSSIENAINSLMEHGAINADEDLTPIGKMLSKLPVDVTIGNMLIMGSLFKMVESALSLASALSVQSPFTNKSYRDPEMMAARKPLESEHGDPFTLLNAYNEWLDIKANKNAGNSRQWCRRRGIEEQRFYELTKLRQQFKDLLRDSGFLDDSTHDICGSSSAERSQRYGELKQLRKLKRSYHTNPRKRKILKLDYDYEIGDAQIDCDDKEIDIKDVEFRMSNDNKQVQELYNASRSNSSADITILKVILCSGIYPQIAIADEHNSYKPDSEQLYHTKSKPFVVLHPMSVFTSQPEVLQLKDYDIIRIPGFVGRGQLSKHHQLLTYGSLLETTKPYLMATMRVSAAHTLLLFAKSLDTNKDFSRIVCDRWLELSFSDSEDAQRTVLQAIELRDLWQQLLSYKLKDKNDDNVDSACGVEIWKLERQLSGGLVEYYHGNRVFYTIRRLLAADVKHLYTESVDEDIDTISDLFSWIPDVKPNTTKGGSQLKEYLTYNCLVDNDRTQESYIRKVWKCTHCEEEMAVTVLERIRHETKCAKKNTDTDETCEGSSSSSSSSAIKRPIFCPDCQQELHMSSIEYLRHKKLHSTIKS